MPQPVLSGGESDMGADGKTCVHCLALPFQCAFIDGATLRRCLGLSGGSQRPLPSCLGDPITLGAAADR